MGLAPYYFQYKEIVWRKNHALSTFKQSVGGGEKIVLIGGRKVKV